MRAPKRPTLRILADETVNDLILEPHVTAFLSAHPALSIALERRSMTGGCRRTAPDLILRYEPSAPAGNAGDILHTQNLLTCAAPRYLRERGLPHHPHDLRGASDALVVSDDPGAPLPWRFEYAGQTLSIKPHIRAVTPSPVDGPCARGGGRRVHANPGMLGYRPRPDRKAGSPSSGVGAQHPFAARNALRRHRRARFRPVHPDAS